MLYSLAGSALRGFFRLRRRGSRFGRRVLRGNAFIAEFLHQGINHRKGRDPQHHAGNAHQVAAHRQGQQHPHPANADGTAHHTGIDHIALKLLQNNEEDDKNQRLHWVDKQNEQRRRNGTEVSAQNGNDTGGAHQHADEQRIGHPAHKKPHDGKPDETQAPQNARLDELAGNKPAECPVDLADDVLDPLPDAVLEEGTQQMMVDVVQVLLIRQNVDGENKSQKAIDDAAGKTCDKGKQPCRRASNKVLDEGTGLIDQLFPLLPQVADDLVFHIQPTFQPVEEISSIAYITGNVIGKAQQAFPYLRQDEQAQGRNDGQHTQDGKDDT